MAKRVHEATGCSLPTSGENARWWPVLYVGRGANPKEDGTYVWRLRDELKQALEDAVDISEGVGEDIEATGGEGAPVRMPYTREDFLHDVYISPARYVPAQRSSPREEERDPAGSSRRWQNLCREEARLVDHGRAG